MGGGQLARMFVHAAQAMGLPHRGARPDADSPAGTGSHLHLRADYLDAAALAELADAARQSPPNSRTCRRRLLAPLAAQRPVRPRRRCGGHLPAARREKALFRRCGVPCAPHALIRRRRRPGRVDRAVPGILKTARSATTARARSRRHAARAGRGLAQPRRRACVLEKRLALRREISVIVARGADGQMVHLPVQQNLHRDGILAVTQVPAPDCRRRGRRSGGRHGGALAAAMHYVGVLCVEFFVLDDGTLLANEMAPRPHNSGHYSIDACDVSQFELQVRSLAGAAAGRAAPALSAAVMLNLLGDLWLRRDAPHARLGRGAGAARCASAPVRQGRGAARPQDGASDGDRGRCRRRTAARAAGRRLPRPAGFLSLRRCRCCEARDPARAERRSRSALAAGELVAFPDRDGVRPGRARRRRRGRGRASSPPRAGRPTIR